MITTSSSCWLRNADEDMIDENCFHNCVSPFSSSVNKRISLPIMKTGLNNTVNKTHIWFHDFIHICFDTISLRMVRGEETAVFAGKGYIETVMCDTSNACLQSWLHEMLLCLRYENATPNFCYVSCAVNRRNFLRSLHVSTHSCLALRR